jgi:hypothetical protein
VSLWCVFRAPLAVAVMCPILKVATDIQKIYDKELLYILVLMSHIRYQDARDLKAVVIPSLISRVIRSTTSSICFRVQNLSR